MQDIFPLQNGFQHPQNGFQHPKNWSRQPKNGSQHLKNGCQHFFWVYTIKMGLNTPKMGVNTPKMGPLSGRRNWRACCLPQRWQACPRRVRQTRLHKRSAIYHESSPTRPKEETMCGACVCVLCCVLSCEFYVSKPIICVTGGVYNQPVHIVSYSASYEQFG